MLFRTLLVVASLGFAFSPGALGQGDDCSSAASIQGLGSWAFDNSGFTSSGFTGASSCIDSLSIQRDGFYQWTAAVDGHYVLGADAPGFLVGFRVLEGMGCASNCVDVVRSSGTGLVPKVLLVDVQAGDTFLIQLGSSDFFFGSVALEIAVFSDPCTAGPDDAFENNDVCSNPSPIVPGSFTNLVATVLDSDFYSIVVPAHHDLVVDWDAGGAADIDGVVFDSACNEIAQAPWMLEYTNTSGLAETIVFELNVDDYFATRNCAVYSMDVSITPNHCLLGTEDFLEDNDSCASPITLVSGTYTGLRTSPGDADYFEVVIPPLHSYSVHVARTDGVPSLSPYDGNCVPIGGLTATQAYGHNTSHVTPMVRIFGVEAGDGGPFADCAGYVLYLNVYANPCLDFPDDGLGGTDCASAPSLLDGTYTGLTMSASTRDFYRFCVGAGVTLQLDALFSHATGNVDLALWEYDATQCAGFSSSLVLQRATSETDDESLSWTNTTGADFEVVLVVQIGGGPGFTCNEYDLVVFGADNCGMETSFCSVPVPNSSGLLTRIQGFKGNTPGSGLHLGATGGPFFEFGYFLVGSGAASGGFSLGDGSLCLAIGPNDRIGRYNVSGTAWNSLGRFDGVGRFVGLAGNSTAVFGFDVPGTLPFGGVISAGDTWHFQLWHRDSGSSNLSDALRVTF